MKKYIYIINSGDGPIYFSTARKAYDYATNVIQYPVKTYETYLRHLKKNGCYILRETEDTQEDIVKVEIDQYY